MPRRHSLATTLKELGFIPPETRLSDLKVPFSPRNIGPKCKRIRSLAERLGISADKAMALTLHGLLNTEAQIQTARRAIDGMTHSRCSVAAIIAAVTAANTGGDL